MSKTISILTTFYAWDKQYSLTSVVNDQIIANLKYGYKVVLFVLPSFKDDQKVPQGTEIRKVVPQLILEGYRDFQTPPNWKKDVEKVVEAFEKHLEDIDVVISHDLHFQEWFTPYAAAIHEVCNRGKLKCKWLLWTHSAPSPKPDVEWPHSARFNLPKGAKLIYLNNSDATILLAESYNTWLSEVRVVHNSVDPRSFWNLHPFTKYLIDKYDLLSADYMAIYPLSSTRMVSGKQVDKAVKIMSKLKKLDNKVRYVVCNAHANAENEKKTIKDLQEKFSDWGLSNTEIIFTSLEQAPIYEQGVPREVVSDLFQLSNLFIFPTNSENCSLILLEAMLAKNLLVLNRDCPSLREFGKENALYFSFGGLGADTKYDDEEKYYEDIAKIIENQMGINRPLKAQRNLLQNFNYDKIFREIEKLYYE